MQNIWKITKRKGLVTSNIYWWKWEVEDRSQRLNDQSGGNEFKYWQPGEGNWLA